MFVGCGRKERKDWRRRTSGGQGSGGLFQKKCAPKEAYEKIVRVQSERSSFSHKKSGIATTQGGAIFRHEKKEDLEKEVGEEQRG